MENDYLTLRKTDGETKRTVLQPEYRFFIPGQNVAEREGRTHSTLLQRCEKIP